MPCGYVISLQYHTSVSCWYVLHILREASASLLVRLRWAMRRPLTVERATVQTSRFPVYTQFNANVGVRRHEKKMDSIQLLSETAGKFGQRCSIFVFTGATYSSYLWICETTHEYPFTPCLVISEDETKRVRTPLFREIGVPCEVISNIQF